jgi:hypothetical protein
MAFPFSVASRVQPGTEGHKQRAAAAADAARTPEERLAFATKTLQWEAFRVSEKLQRAVNHYMDDRFPGVVGAVMKMIGHVNNSRPAWHRICSFTFAARLKKNTKATDEHDSWPVTHEEVAQQTAHGVIYSLGLERAVSARIRGAPGADEPAPPLNARSAYGRSAELTQHAKKNILEHHMYCIALLDAENALGALSSHITRNLFIPSDGRFLCDEVKRTGTRYEMVVYLPMFKTATKKEHMAEAFTVTQEDGGPVLVRFEETRLGQLLVALNEAYDEYCAEQYPLYVAHHKQHQIPGEPRGLKEFCEWN